MLEVTDLSTHFATARGTVKAVDGVTFALAPGEILGLVGESGSGKSMLGYSLMGLVDSPGKVVAGSIKFDGSELSGLNDAGWRSVRGKSIAMIFQDPMMTLNPVLRIDTQMIEAVLAHDRVSAADARARARAALVQVGIASPDERLESYPHQFSGGMRQRVAIAIALLHRPKLIIADEPTTALDVTIQGQILFEMQRLCEETKTALIWITHDLSVVAGLASRIAVMYAGRLVELGATDDVLTQPLHPYTRGLLASLPSRNVRGERLRQIAGAAPQPGEIKAGCAFAPRCGQTTSACFIATPHASEASGRIVRCLNVNDSVNSNINASVNLTAVVTA